MNYNHFNKVIALLSLIIIIGQSTVLSQTLAFPEAKGYGAYARGGRGGRIIEVTNLNDSGEGSLRAAVEASGPRIVIFRVSGYIDITSPIRLENPYITIAGQTAPGDGVCVRMKPGNPEGIGGLFYSSNSSNPHDVIVRYLKFRQGWTLTYKYHGTRPINVYFRRGHDIILDHISTQWTRDNLFTISLGSGAVEADSIYNFSIQNTLLGESEEGHSTGMNIQGTSNSDRGECFYTGKWVKRVSVHRNLFTGSDHRNPRVNTNVVRVINNVIYNWGNRAGESTHDVKVDYINNYYKGGPQTTDDTYYYRIIHEPWESGCEDSPPASIYMSGNIMTPHYNPPSDPYDFYEMYLTRFPLEDKYKRYEELASAPVPVPILSVEETYDSVLADVGCNARLDDDGAFIANSDEVDIRMINDVINGTGFDHEVDSLDWASGTVSFPDIDAGTPYIDEDKDGMADSWEMNYFGSLDSAQYNDSSKTDYDRDGYFDLEEFLNGSNPKINNGDGKTQFAIKTSTDGPGSIKLNPEKEWYDDGSKVVITAYPFGSYVFDHWEGDINSTENPDTVVMDDFKNITAVFLPPSAINGEGNDNIPNKYSLKNYPNPFNPTTKITYTIPKAGNVTIGIYDIIGKKICTLIDSEYKSAGAYSFIWNAADNGLNRLPSGIYIVNLKVGPHNKSVKVLLLQ